MLETLNILTQYGPLKSNPMAQRPDLHKYRFWDSRLRCFPLFSIGFSSWIFLALLLFVICPPSFSLVVHCSCCHWFSSRQILLLRSLLLLLVLLFLLLLLLLLLTYGMMVLKIKSPPRRLGGSRCSVLLPCCCSLIGFVVAGFVPYSSCCWLFCRDLEKHRSREAKTGKSQKRKESKLQKHGPLFPQRLLKRKTITNKNAIKRKIA